MAKDRLAESLLSKIERQALTERHKKEEDFAQRGGKLRPEIQAADEALKTLDEDKVRAALEKKLNGAKNATEDEDDDIEDEDFAPDHVSMKSTEDVSDDEMEYGSNSGDDEDSGEDEGVEDSMVVDEPADVTIASIGPPIQIKADKMPSSAPVSRHSSPASAGEVPAEEVDKENRSDLSMPRMKRLSGTREPLSDLSIDPSAETGTLSPTQLVEGALGAPFQLYATQDGQGFIGGFTQFDAAFSQSAGKAFLVRHNLFANF